MRTLGGFLLIFLIIGGFLLALGTGIGLLLRWIIPGVDLGIGILIGVITIGFTAQLLARIVSMPLADIDGDPEYAEPPIPERITYIIDPTPPRRRQRRKQS
jgi:hypothetical protein